MCELEAAVPNELEVEERAVTAAATFTLYKNKTGKNRRKIRNTKTNKISCEIKVLHSLNDCKWRLTEF